MQSSYKPETKKNDELNKFIDGFIQSNNIPDKYKESFKIAFTKNILKTEDIILVTKKKLLEFGEIFLHLSITLEKIHEIKDLKVDGFLKATSLIKLIAERKKELASNKELAMKNEKTFLTGMILKIKELDEIYAKIKRSESEQQSAYKAYMMKPFTKDMFKSRENEYENSFELFRKNIFNNQEFKSNPVMNNAISSITVAYFVNIIGDKKHYEFIQENANKLYGIFESMNCRIEKDFSVPVNGSYINVSTCMETIESTLNNNIVLSLKQKVMQANQPTTTPSSTVAINRAIQTQSNLNNNKPVITTQSSLSLPPPPQIARDKKNEATPLGNTVSLRKEKFPPKDSSSQNNRNELAENKLFLLSSRHDKKHPQSNDVSSSSRLGFSKKI